MIPGSVCHILLCELWHNPSIILGSSLVRAHDCSTVFTECPLCVWHCVLCHSEGDGAGNSPEMWEGIHREASMETWIQGHVKPSSVLSLLSQIKSCQWRSEEVPSSFLSWCSLLFWEGGEVRKSRRKLWAPTREKAQAHSAVHTTSQVCWACGGPASLLCANPREALPQAWLGGPELQRGSILSKFPCSAWMADLLTFLKTQLGTCSSRKRWHAQCSSLL